MCLKAPLLDGRQTEQRSCVGPPTTRKQPVLIQQDAIAPSTAHREDRAGDVHDYFNLVALIPMIILNAINWNWSMLASMPDNHTLENAWTGEWFTLFSAYTLSYFVVDLLWVILIPTSVKSPATIVQHHIVSLIYLSTPIFYPEFRYAMGTGLSVEINTWLLIARRVLNKQRGSLVLRFWNKESTPRCVIDPTAFVLFKMKLVSFLFYVTWISIRLVVYPCLLVEIVKRYNELSAQLDSRFNIWLLILPLHTSFVFMNFKWSYDLAKSKIRRWRLTNGRESIAKGL